MKTLAQFYGNLAENVAQDFHEKLTGHVATTADLTLADDTLKVLEEEAEGLSLKATSFEERMDAERTAASIRNHRENLGFPSRNALFATIERSLLQ